MRKEYSEVKFSQTKPIWVIPRQITFAQNNAIGEYLLFLNPDIILDIGSCQLENAEIYQGKVLGADGGDSSILMVRLAKILQEVSKTPLY